MRLNIKSHKKTEASLSLAEDTNLEKVTTTVKICSKIALSEISQFPILGIEQNRKLGNLGSFLFFLLNPLYNVRFLSPFIFVISEF